MNKIILCLGILIYASAANSFQFGNSDFYEKECLQLIKNKYSIDGFVKSSNIERLEENKYDFTPVIVRRGVETELTRHFCEYYPDEEMVYIGIAKSVIEAQRKEEILEKKRKIIAEKKKREAEEAAAKHTAELQRIQNLADQEAAEAAARKSAEIAAQREAERIKQKKKEKLEAQKRAESERVRRKKYDPIAKQCLEEAVVSDFSAAQNNFRKPSSMKIGSNRTAFFKPINQRVSSYVVSEGEIIIKYTYDARLFYKLKRNGDIKDGYNTYRRSGDFICESKI